jgi:hypothetical protein
MFDQPEPAAPNSGIQIGSVSGISGGTINIAGGNIYQAAVDPAIQAALVLPRVWSAPAPPRPRLRLVGRKNELDALRSLLTPPGDETLTGESTCGPTVALYGLPGCGKSLLSTHLAVKLRPVFPAGVFFETLGPAFSAADMCQPILDRWAACAYGGVPLPRDAHFSPAAVRGLLAGHGPFLVVLDDVWDLAAVQPLLDALPIDGSLLITTASEQLARSTGGEILHLDMLDESASLDLLRQRAPQAGPDQNPILSQLARALGYHALALTIAGSWLASRDLDRWPAAVAEMITQVETGAGYGDLGEPDQAHFDSPPLRQAVQSPVEAALALSYQALSLEARERWRHLGVFAVNASFRADDAAALWGLARTLAQDQLRDLAGRGLVLSARSGRGASRWQLPNLLRAFALARLREAKEEEPAAAHHARLAFARLQKAERSQSYHLILPDYPQFVQARDWALDHDLRLSVALTALASSLQSVFGLARDRLRWAQAVQARAAHIPDGSDPILQGSIQILLGNALIQAAPLPDANGAAARRVHLQGALQAFNAAAALLDPARDPLDYAGALNNRVILLAELATLPGEDGPARLREALSACEDCLRVPLPGSGPELAAMLQNNRGNLLRAAASLPGEKPAALLRQALQAYDLALGNTLPEEAPLSFATIQNNRALVLKDMAALAQAEPENEQNQRAEYLRQSLEAITAALSCRSPETAPLDYAQAQDNRATILAACATPFHPDSAAMLTAALQASSEALLYRTAADFPIEHAVSLNNRASLLLLCTALPSAAPGPLPAASLGEALACAWEAYTTFDLQQHSTFARDAQDTLLQVARALSADLPDAWAALQVGPLPAWLIPPPPRSS